MTWYLTHARFCNIFSFPFIQRAGYGGKQQKMLELSIYFMEGFEISTECVC